MATLLAKSAAWTPPPQQEPGLGQPVSQPVEVPRPAEGGDGAGAGQGGLHHGYGAAAQAVQGGAEPKAPGAPPHAHAQPQGQEGQPQGLQQPHRFPNADQGPASNEDGRKGKGKGKKGKKGGKSKAREEAQEADAQAQEGGEQDHAQEEEWSAEGNWAEKGKGKGKNKGKGKQQGTMEEIVDSMRRLLVVHERKIGGIWARSSFTIVLRSQTAQDTIWNERDKWRTADLKEREAWQADEKPNQPVFFEHSLGPQRTLMFAIMLDQLKSDIEASAHEDKARIALLVNQLLSLDAGDLTATVFRLKPRYEDPLTDGSPWVWQLCLEDGTASEVLKNLKTIARDYKGDGLSLMNTRHIDGPMAKWLAALPSPKGKGKGKGKGQGKQWSGGNSSGGQWGKQPQQNEWQKPKQHDWKKSAPNNWQKQQSSSWTSSAWKKDEQ